MESIQPEPAKRGAARADLAADIGRGIVVLVVLALLAALDRADVSVAPDHAPAGQLAR